MRVVEGLTRVGTDGGLVPGAAVRDHRRMSLRARLTVSALLVLVLAGCSSSGLPDRSPEVTGTVAADGAGQSLTAVSDDYYEGMALRLTDAAVVDADGARVDAPSDGDEVEVWLAGGCNESSPVQCTVVAVRVLG